MPFEPWQERVIEECDQLAGRTVKLQQFLLSGKVLAPTDRFLLEEQHDAMRQYLRILEVRVSRLNGTHA